MRPFKSSVKHFGSLTIIVTLSYKKKNSNLIVRVIKKDLEINLTFLYTFSLYHRMIVLHSVPTPCPLQDQFVFFIWA